MEQSYPAKVLPHLWVSAKNKLGNTPVLNNLAVVTYKNKSYKLIKPAFWLALPFLFLYAPFAGISQQKPQEERPASIYTETFLKDSAAIINQLKLADGLAEQHTDSAIKLARHAVASSQQLHFNFGLAASLYYCGFLYQIKGDHPLSITTLQSALLYCDPTPKGNEVRIKILSTLGEVYWYYGKADSTSYYNYKVLDEIERLQIKKPAILIESYTQLIRLWLNLKDYPTDVANDKYIQNAVNYLNKAELLNASNKNLLPQVLLSKGQLKSLQKDYDSARFFYNNYLTAVRQSQYGKNRSNSWGSAMMLNISDLFLKQNNADSAMWYAKAALKELPANGGKEFMHYIFANYYIGKAFCLQKKYREAIAITLPALVLSQQKKVYFMREMAHETLAEAYRETGNFKQALDQQIAYSTVKDSLMRIGKMQAISQMEMKYQVAQKDKTLTEKELAIVKKDSSIKTKNVWIAFITASLVLILAISITLFLRSRHRQQIITLQATIAGEENERRRLAQELHDGIGGQLGIMRMQLDTALRKNGIADPNGDFASLTKQIDNTYTELRKTAHNLMPETVVKEGLAKAAAVFCASIGSNTGLDITFETLGNVPRLALMEELALYRMVQELVQNIIKHAKASEALVHIGYDGNMLGITVEDNGTGITENTDKPSGRKGLGLLAIQERIQAMGGRMDIFSQPGNGTSINIELYTANINVLK